MIYIAIDLIPSHLWHLHFRAAYGFVLDLAQREGALDEAALLRLHALLA